MGRKKLLARREGRRNTTVKRAMKSLVGNLAYVFLGGAVVFFAVVLTLAARHVPASPAQSAAAATRMAATADAGSGWIPLASEAPGAIIAAARKTTLFNVDRSGNGDYLKDLSHLETPVLVRVLQSPDSVIMPDYYVIPIDDKSGAMVGAAELELNSAHTAVQLTSIITYSTPRPHGRMPRVDMPTAEANLARQSHVSLRHGAQPQLIYIPIDATALETGEVTWNAGGEYPADPVWLIPGSDGQDHVVGADGHAYKMSEVPLMKRP